MDPVNIIGVSLLAITILLLVIDAVRTWYQDRAALVRRTDRRAQERLAGIPSWTLVGRNDPF